MAPDVQGIFREVLKGVQGGGGGANGASRGSGRNGASGDGHGLSGMKGLAAGAGAAALAPVVLRNAGKLARNLGINGLGDVVTSPGEALADAKSNLGDHLTSSVKEHAGNALEEAGGPGGVLKDAVKQMLPFGNRGGRKGGSEGVGKGRRMPIQQWVDIGIPIEAVYNQFTQFEDWPEFMHRVKRVTQDDDCTVSFAVKIWGKTKEFTADIETQRPDQRIKWKTSQGMTHTGVVTFHELGPNLTRLVLSFDLDPASLLEKFARGARHVKRAARGDLHRFVALIETAEHETGAWRGVIEDGELVEEHDPSYDEQRQYSDIQELTGQEESDEDDEADGQDGESSEDAKQSPKPSSQRQRSRSSGQGRNRDGSRRSQRKSQPARSASSGSGKSQARTRPSRQSRDGGSSNSRSNARSRSSRGSSGGQSRSRSRAQSSKG